MFSMLWRGSEIVPVFRDTRDALREASRQLWRPKFIGTVSGLSLLHDWHSDHIESKHICIDDFNGCDFLTGDAMKELVVISSLRRVSLWSGFGALSFGDEEYETWRWNVQALETWINEQLQDQITWTRPM